MRFSQAQGLALMAQGSRGPAETEACNRAPPAPPLSRQYTQQILKLLSAPYREAVAADVTSHSFPGAPLPNHGEHPAVCVTIA